MRPKPTLQLIAQERGLFVQEFEKATTKGSEKAIASNQSALSNASATKGKIEIIIEKTKIAMVEDLRSISDFCNRYVAAGCTANLSKTEEFLENLKHVQIEDLDVLKDYLKSVEKYITSRTQLTEVEVKIKALRQAIAFLKAQKRDKDSRYKDEDAFWIGFGIILTQGLIKLLYIHRII